MSSKRTLVGLSIAVVGISSGFLSFASAKDEVQSGILQTTSEVRGDFSDSDRKIFNAEIENKKDLPEDLKKNYLLHVHSKVCGESAPGEVHCDAQVIDDANGKPAASTGPVGFGPQAIAKAYNIPSQSSKRPIVAIVVAYDHPSILSDLNTYSAQFGLPKMQNCTGAIAQSNTPCFKKVNQDGNTTWYPGNNSTWALETALDVETIHGLCQNCSILLVEATASTYANLLAADDVAVAQGAKIVSNSWGSTEFPSQTSFDSHFNKPGVVFAFSAGDAGYGAQYPASSQYVTAVGGTTLFLNSDGTYNTESVWAGSGSGCSAYETKPSWQKDTGCTKRTVADVAAVADPNTGAAVYTSYPFNGQTGWFQIGGTSLATPIIAVAYAMGSHTQPWSQANSIPYIYNPVVNLHDVKTGSNGSCGNSYLCTGKQGYDGPTGLGTPRGVGAF